MPLSKQQQEYLAQRIQSASPQELIRILYEAAVHATEQAVLALRSGDILERGRAVTKTIEILSELQSALRHDVSKEYSETLAGLYGYMRGQLIRAHAEQSEELLLEVSRLLLTLLEGWTGAIEKLRSEQPQKQEAASATAAHGASGANPYSAEAPAEEPKVRSWQL